jgi:hypothetical protein
VSVCLSLSLSGVLSLPFCKRVRLRKREKSGEKLTDKEGGERQCESEKKRGERGGGRERERERKGGRERKRVWGGVRRCIHIYLYSFSLSLYFSLPHTHTQAKARKAAVEEGRGEEERTNVRYSSVQYQRVSFAP